MQIGFHKNKSQSKINVKWDIGNDVIGLTLLLFLLWTESFATFPISRTLVTNLGYIDI